MTVGCVFGVRHGKHVSIRTELHSVRKGKQDQMKRPDRFGEHRTAFDRNRQIILQTQNVCGICGKEVDRSFKYPHPLSATVDHIIPIAKGGHPSEIANLQLAHRWCNRWKSDKLIESMRQEQGKAACKDTNISQDLPHHFDWFNYTAGSSLCEEEQSED